MTTDEPLKETAASTHNEYAEDGAHALLETQVKYDEGRTRDLLDSPYVIGAAVLASLGGFSFGYDQGVISIILVMTQFREQFPKVSPDHPSYGFNTGFMTGMLELGAFIGCLVFPSITDRISRKWGLTVATVVFVIGGVIQTAAFNYDTLVAGRFIGGIGVGTLAMGAPLYISEISPPYWRGALLVLESISVVFGGLVSYWITYGTRQIQSDWSFRLPFLLQIPPALLVGCGIHFFPYSPRWLAMRGRKEESLASLSKLRRRPEHDELVQLEWKGILSEVQFQREVLIMEYPNTRPSMIGLKQWLSLFKPKYFRRTLVALAIPFFQQFSGVNGFIYYAPSFFQSLGQDHEMSLVLSGMVHVCQLAGNIPMFMLLDRVGRRKMAIFGGIFMAIPHVIISSLVGKFSSNWPAHTGVGWLCAALIYCYVLSYAMSYGPLAYVLPSEVFPNSKRAKGVGAATAMIWISNFIIGVAVPEMLIKLGWGTFLFFGIFCLIAAIFSYLFVPETSGKSLEQVAAVFGDNMINEEKELQIRIARDIWHSPLDDSMPSLEKQVPV